MKVLVLKSSGNKKGSYDVWDFELTADEMAQMSALEKDERFSDY